MSLSYHQRKIEEAKQECSRAPWYKKYICIGTGFKIAYHGVAIAGLEIARGVALGVLEAARYFLKGVQAIIKVTVFVRIFKGTKSNEIKKVNINLKSFIKNISLQVRASNPEK